MNGDNKKKILSEEEAKIKFGMAGEYGTSVSEKNLTDGSNTVPLGTKLSEEIVQFKTNLEFLSSEDWKISQELVDDFEKILNDMFLLMHHHRYGVLYNILKKFR